MCWCSGIGHQAHDQLYWPRLGYNKAKTLTPNRNKYDEKKNV
jgi:hypothetical protein